MHTPSPLVSVVIAAYNDAAHLAECLDALARQDYGRDNYEVVVVDDGSTDETSAVVRALSWVRYLYQENAGPSSARNLGVRKSKGGIIAFTDSDCVPEPGWLSALVAVFEAGDERLGAVGGPHIGHPDDALFAREMDLFLHRIGWATGYIKGSPHPGKVGHVASCNAAYKRHVFLRAGGFRPGLFPGEDVDLDRRIRKIGYHIQFTPVARVLHHRPADKTAWRRMLRSYGESSGNIIRLHGPFRLIHVLSPLLLGNLLLILVLCLATPFAFWVISGEAIAFCLLCGYLSRPTLGFCRILRFTCETMVYYSLGYWTRLVCFRPMPLSKNLSEG